MALEQPFLVVQAPSHGITQRGEIFQHEAARSIQPTLHLAQTGSCWSLKYYKPTNLLHWAGNALHTAGKAFGKVKPCNLRVLPQKYTLMFKNKLISVQKYLLCKSHPGILRPDNPEVNLGTGLIRPIYPIENAKQFKKTPKKTPTN